MDSQEKYGWVNALRGYAILLVILIHSSQHYFCSEHMGILTHTGDLGVQLFFLMSSFTLFNSYSKRKNEDKKYVKRSFFIRRIFRIAPYYYIAGIIYMVYAIVNNESINILYILANYTFINGIILPAINYLPPGGWSVGVEMLFYLTIPILFKYITNLKRAISLLFVMIFLSNILNFGIYYYISNFTNRDWNGIRGWYLYFWLPNQFPVFIYGIILYYIYKDKIIKEKLGKIFLTTSVLIFIILAFVKFSNSYPAYFFQREYVYGFVFLLFSIGAYSTRMKFINNVIIQKIGIVSFSMYLNHFIILYVFGSFYKHVVRYLDRHNIIPSNLFNNDFMFIVLYSFTVFSAYLISCFTFKHIEVKGINLGNVLINKMKKNFVKE